MKILITGAKGFIGRNLAERLGGKHELLTPPRAELELLDELAVEKYFKENRVDCIIHCANVGATRRTDNLPQIVGNNLRMFLNMARQEKHFQKMVFFGSGSEFDKREPLVKVSEGYKSANLPESDYGLSKYLCSHFISESEKIINLRIFGVYGRHDDYENRFVTNAICRSILGLPIVIFQDQLMDFIFVDDLVRVVDQFLGADVREKFYHMGTGRPSRLLEIAEEIKIISGKDTPIVIQKSGLANEYTCDNQRLKSQLGDFEFTPIKQALKILYKWYQDNSSLIGSKKFV